ncbi:MAG TPA: DegT/DnrJ/EryC1/StrS family aminotransferase [Solirubrobacteraceae bacterium]|nr:DegT/DnrJ/EryC1/StrS family aminotransferase [Solirubrobacteraceae bacterium]
MADWTVPLADVRFDEGDVAAVAEVYREGWVTMGPRVERFEAAFAAFLGRRHAIAVASATTALHLLAVGLGLEEGDEVVMPSLTFVATASAFRHTGARPVFADVAALDRPWPEAADYEAVLTPRTRAVVTMAYGGHPGDVAAVARLAERRGLPLVEDAAHAPGASVGGHAVGAFGIGSAFSFYSNKNLPVGEGGLVATDDHDLAARLRRLRSHGTTSGTWARHQGDARDYDVVEPGFNYRLDEPRAALALRRLERLGADNARRRDLSARYRRALAGVPGLLPAAEAAGDAVTAAHLFTVVLPEGTDVAGVRGHLQRRGVQTSLHYPPVHRLSAYASGARLPNTEAYAQRAVTLPLSPELSEDQQDLVVAALLAALG